MKIKPQQLYSGMVGQQRVDLTKHWFKQARVYTEISKFPCVDCYIFVRGFVGDFTFWFAIL